ncbi:hypothetical protein HPB52_006932 [Rhipicephalus sanguineus]|uniref:Nuclease HARBI1 n=1 Tax=Rhipicephalus sanguineus TaxID=34632 RepID=A0A9D4QK40_RHISA|nr:hypothetical protein HPB52_006932 [Rhipicephalus sanguineus]
MANNMTMRGSTTDAPAPELRRRRLLRVVTTWMAMRAKHRSEERLLRRLALEEQEAFTRACEDARCANLFTMAAIAIELLHPIQRERWAFQRNERQSLRVTPATSIYLVNVLTPVLERADTNMRPAVSVAKRIAIGLYRLRSTAEDATIAHLFGVGRYTCKRIECKIKTAKQAIRAACLLHNICETLKDPVEYQWEQELHDFNTQYPQPAHSSTDVSSGDGERVREALANYFFRQAQQQ